MNWDELKGQLEAAVKQEAIKALDEAIARLQQLKREYEGQAAAQPEAHVMPATDPPPQGVRREPLHILKLAPRNCKVCGVEFTPTHHTQKKCLEHRGGQKRELIGQKRELIGLKRIGTDSGLTEEEKEWKRYGESVTSKLSKRPEAQVLPRNGDGR
jgi:DNA repair exonuclease SbcCD ATPase subunit